MAVNSTDLEKTPDESPRPRVIRRGEGLRLSVATPAADDAAPATDETLTSSEVADVPVGPKRRGKGLRLSTETLAQDAPPVELEPQGDAQSVVAYPPASVPIAVPEQQPEQQEDTLSVEPLPAVEPVAWVEVAPKPVAIIEQVGQVRLAHGNVSYRQAGEGPPLLLLHGWVSSSRVWHNTMMELGLSRDCYALDLPGFGGSMPTNEQATLPRLAAIAVAYANELGLEQFDLVGHSFGAAVAACIAARYPERVRRLVLTSVGVQPGAMERSIIGAALRQWQPLLSLWQPWLSLLQPWQATLMSAPSTPSMLASWFLDHTPAEPTVQRALQDSLVDLKQLDLRAHLASLASLGDPDLVASLGAILAPTLVVRGHGDRVLPQGTMVAARDLVPGAQFAVLEHCGHLPMIEQPVAYHRVLREFLLPE